MPIQYIYPDYEGVRNPNRCIKCRVCERQCANEVHSYDSEQNVMCADDSKCVDCHRCVSLCPTQALKIVKTDHTFKENHNGRQAIFRIFTVRPSRAACFWPVWEIRNPFRSIGIRC
jgi:ferredoxin